MARHDLVSEALAVLDSARRETHGSFKELQNLMRDIRAAWEASECHREVCTLEDLEGAVGEIMRLLGEADATILSAREEAERIENDEYDF